MILHENWSHEVVAEAQVCTYERDLSREELTSAFNLSTSALREEISWSFIRMFESALSKLAGRSRRRAA